MEPWRHSGVGITSFVISLISGFGMFAVTLFMGAIVASSPHIIDGESVELAVGGILTLGFVFLSIIAFCLGLGGLCEPQARKTFAILGTVLSACNLGVTLLLLVVGIATS